MFIKDRPVSSLGVFVFEFLGASFSRFGCFVFDRCFVFEFWVLRFRDLGASCFGLRFRNYPHPPPSRMIFVRLEILKVL